MKNIIAISVMLILLFSQSILAQLTVKDQEPSPNTLLQVNDEGDYCSILITPSTSYIVDPDQKLYNYMGKLMWNGLELGSSFTAAGWTYDGTNILTSTVNDKVGIGMSTAPNVKLSLGTDFAAKKLAIWDGTNDFYGFGSPFGRMAIYTSNNERMSILSNGNIGIGTTTPGANLEVNGTVKVGSSGIKFSEIIELTGTTGTSRTEISYPIGYTKANTRIISYQVVDFTGPNWVTGFDGLWVALDDSVIKLGHESSVFNGQPYRLILMKVE